MKRRLVISSLLIVTLAGASFSSGQKLGVKVKKTDKHPSYAQYVGAIYPPLPAGLEEEDGEIVGESTGAVMYSLSWIQSNGADMVWFSKSLHPENTGKGDWLVIDVLPVPDFGPQHSLIMTQCSLKGAPDPEIVAVVWDEDVEVLGKVKAAWRANRLKGKFERIPAKGITCLNEGYGE